MKYLKTIIIALVVFSCQQGYGQCAGKSKGTRGYNAVKYFITLKFNEDKRTETGATNEPESSIQVVEDSKICLRIEKLLDDNADIANVAPHDDISKYFYETENYYYALWALSPEFDGIPRTGPRRQFVVIKKDFSQHWKYYL
jgi:hypothetical protein